MAAHLFIQQRHLAIDQIAQSGLSSLKVIYYSAQLFRISRPQGGFLLWVELPPAFDTLRLNRQLESKGVQVAVGPIFSASGKYRHCLRLNYANLMTPAIEAAVKCIGETVAQQLEACALLTPAAEAAQDGQ